MRKNNLRKLCIIGMMCVMLTGCNNTVNIVSNEGTQELTTEEVTTEEVTTEDITTEEVTTKEVSQIDEAIDFAINIVNDRISDECVNVTYKEWPKKYVYESSCIDGNMTGYERYITIEDGKMTYKCYYGHSTNNCIMAVVSGVEADSFDEAIIYRVYDEDNMREINRYDYSRYVEETNDEYNFTQSAGTESETITIIGSSKENDGYVISISEDEKQASVYKNDKLFIYIVYDVFGRYDTYAYNTEGDILLKYWYYPGVTDNNVATENKCYDEYGLLVNWWNDLNWQSIEYTFSDVDYSGIINRFHGYLQDAAFNSIFDN